MHAKLQFLEKLASAVRRLPVSAPTAPYAVGVSGGADSVALLRGLILLGFKNLVVLHVEHGLRGEESLADAEFVKNLAAKYGCQFYQRSVAVKKLAAQSKQSTETVGRAERLRFFAEMTTQHQLEGVFVAHHQDDLAETLLLHLFRGTAGRGLQGLAAESTVEAPGQAGWVKLLRPLLGIRRDELRAWLTDLPQDWREDSSNEQRDVVRNRIRHELLPLANTIFARDVTPLLSNLAAIQCEEETYWESVLPDTWREPKLATAELSAQHPSLAKRLLVEWLRSQKVTNISQPLIQQALGLVQNEYPASINLPGGGRLRRTQGQLWIESHQRQLK